jgi:hypothetical protein
MAHLASPVLVMLLATALRTPSPAAAGAPTLRGASRRLGYYGGHNRDYELNKTASNTTIKVYHQTSKEICGLILNSTFRVGPYGWCGGAMYFALTPEATRTKAIAPSSHHGCMLEVTVDMGRVMQYPCCGKCDYAYTGAVVEDLGFDSIMFNPGDGEEVVIYNASRIQNITELPWESKWWDQAITSPDYQDSCAHYGCGDHYEPSRPCQCNSRCDEFHNCCADYLHRCSR